MADTIKTIGTGGDYSTINLWEAYIDDLSLTGNEIGECFAEEFTSTVDFNGSPTYNGYRWILRAQEGAEHEGRSHESAGTGHARIVVSSTSTNILRLTEIRMEVAWLEIYNTYTGTSSPYALIQGNTADGRFLIHHNIIHGASQASGQYGIIDPNAPNFNFKVYRNIVYGAGDGGIVSARGDASNDIYFNTVFKCLNASSTNLARGYGIDTSAAWYVGNNAVFDMNKGAGYCIVASDGSTRYGNATSDNTGSVGLTGYLSSNNFVNPTSTLSQVDLRIKGTSANIYQASVSGNLTTYPLATFPEINVPVSYRGYTIPSGITWSIGADEYYTITYSLDLTTYGQFYGKLYGM
jgi:hypothetical protein